MSQMYSMNYVMKWELWCGKTLCLPVQCCQHQEFLESVKIEAKYQVNRLKANPSIVLWCGNNEITIAWHGWGWKEELPSQFGKVQKFS